MVRLALALGVLTGQASAADKLALICEGTSDWYDKGGRLPKDLSIIVDLDGRTLSIGGPPLPITKLTEGRIDFNGFADQGETTHFWGHVDRISGNARVWCMFRGKPLYEYALTCKPAKPLF
jgi:hypothetical protein